MNNKKVKNLEMSMNENPATRKHRVGVYILLTVSFLLIIILYDPELKFQSDSTEKANIIMLFTLYFYTGAYSIVRWKRVVSYPLRTMGIIYGLRYASAAFGGFFVGIEKGNINLYLTSLIGSIWMLYTALTNFNTKRYCYKYERREKK